jgi:hypothetical protein
MTSTPTKRRERAILALIAAVALGAGIGAAGVGLSVTSAPGPEKTKSVVIAQAPEADSPVASDTRGEVTPSAPPAAPAAKPAASGRNMDEFETLDLPKPSTTGSAPTSSAPTGRSTGGSTGGSTPVAPAPAPVAPAPAPVAPAPAPVAPAPTWCDPNNATVWAQCTAGYVRPSIEYAGDLRCEAYGTDAWRLTWAMRAVGGNYREIGTATGTSQWRIGTVQQGVPRDRLGEQTRLVVWTQVTFGSMNGLPGVIDTVDFYQEVQLRLSDYCR